jgi:hypothetical protein
MFGHTLGRGQGVAREKFFRGIVGKRRAAFRATLSLAFLSFGDRIRVVSQARDQASRDFPTFFSFYQVSFFAAKMEAIQIREHEI